MDLTRLGPNTIVSPKIMNGQRIGPRIKAVFGAWNFPPQRNVASREELLAAHLCDIEVIAPSAGLCVREYSFVSTPDGNTVKVRFIRPVLDERVPCVYYIHGGGMRSGSCYSGDYRAWGRMIAQRGVGVAMVDFRNALTPSSVPEVAPYPAGLNDCVSGVH